MEENSWPLENLSRGVAGLLMIQETCLIGKVKWMAGCPLQHQLERVKQLLGIFQALSLLLGNTKFSLELQVHKIHQSLPCPNFRLQGLAIRRAIIGERTISRGMIAFGGALCRSEVHCQLWINCFTNTLDVYPVSAHPLLFLHGNAIRVAGVNLFNLVSIPSFFSLLRYYFYLLDMLFMCIFFFQSVDFGPCWNMWKMESWWDTSFHMSHFLAIHDCRMCIIGHRRTKIQLFGSWN